MSAHGLVASVLAASIATIAASGDDKADARIGSARALLRSGRFAAAEAMARAALADAETSSGRDSLEVARALDVLVAALVDAGKARAPETGSLARRAIAIKERVLIAGDAELAVSIHALAEQLRWAGAFSEARAAYERALRIRERAPGTDPAALVESLRGLATLAYELADYPGARSLLDRALEVAERSLGADHPDLALVLVDVARVLRAAGNYKDGRPLLDRALAIQERTVGPDHVDTAYTLRELGELLRLSGDYKSARPRFERSLAIRESVLGRDHLEVADVLTGMGILLRRVGILRDATCPEALPVCERAMAIAERTLGPDHPDLVSYLESLGWAVFQCTRGTNTDRGRAAQPLFERSLRILEATFGPDHPASTDTLEGLGYTTSFQRRAESIEWYRKKLRIEREALGPDSVAVGFTLMQLANARVTLGAYEHVVSEIIDHALEAERITREHALLTGRSLPEREALLLMSERWHARSIAVHFLSDDGGDVRDRRRTWDAFIRSRALVLDTVGSRHRAILETDQPEVKRLAAAMEEAREHLAHLTVRDSGTMFPAQRRRALDEARRRKEETERELASRSASFAVEFERSRIGIDEVAAHLPPEAALVAYAHYWSRTTSSQDYVAFVLSPGEATPILVPLGKREEVDRLVGDWRQRVASAPGDDASERISRAAGERLRARIWDPIARHLGNPTRVFIVPEGMLNMVSFAALPVGADGYLVERGAVLHYLSSERDLVPPSTRPRGEGLLALGAPLYDAASAFDREPGGARSTAIYRGPRSACDSFRHMRFAPLPDAERETRSVVELWTAGLPSTGTASKRPRTVHLLGGEASESAFKHLAPGRRILHVATHGFFLGDACPSSTDPTAETLLESPLLRSGLALAGANRRTSAEPDEEDGILTAEEVAALDLSGVEWAVLSACDTASGDIRSGEGVLGLRRAFQIAGVRTLVMSLWPIDDKATRRWMRELYTLRLRDKLDTASAVRGAMLSILSDRRRRGLSTDPFYWAGFIAAGDWR